MKFRWFDFCPRAWKSLICVTSGTMSRALVPNSFVNDWFCVMICVIGCFDRRFQFVHRTLFSIYSHTKQRNTSPNWHKQIKKLNIHGIWFEIYKRDTVFRLLFSRLFNSIFYWQFNWLIAKFDYFTVEIGSLPKLALQHRNIDEWVHHYNWIWLMNILCKTDKTPINLFRSAREFLHSRNANLMN